MDASLKMYHNIHEELRRSGLLLGSDYIFPSVVGFIAGERVKGSWWARGDSHLIFKVMKRLQSSPEVLEARMVSGKVTFIHKRLWPELFAIGSSREGWQMTGLSNDARRLLRLVDEKGEAKSDEIHWKGKGGVGNAARELEKRLLVQSEEIHTMKGLHAKIIRSWSHLSRKTRIPTASVGVQEAKARFESLINRLNKEHGSNGHLPWTMSRQAPRR